MHFINSLTLLLLSLTLALAAPTPIQVGAEPAPGMSLQAKSSSLHTPHAHEEVVPQVLEKRRGGRGGSALAGHAASYAADALARQTNDPNSRLNRGYRKMGRAAAMRHRILESDN